MGSLFYLTTRRYHGLCIIIVSDNYTLPRPVGLSLFYNNNNNNNIYILQLGCYPVAVVILHVYKI